ncbi:hypothetical protein [Roseateles oligotrophus]|uniref:Lipoprotein n=1 Tax=Roseateles oligotrophus TaxID=1769250 RepID=A0ABT2Y967_9BURK|nr:hypothetical protein [Roseateles oligotrophus]MCV2366847.1 hypothetical protein [Roseateles oligotrophus]
MKVRLLLLAAIALLNLPGCAEREQKLLKKAGSDASMWSVSEAANPGFKAAGWAPGDRASWEAQIRRRNQAQNDYSR